MRLFIYLFIDANWRLLLDMNRFNKTMSAIFISLMCSLLSEELNFLGKSSLQLVLCHVVDLEYLPIHHQSTDYIFSGQLACSGGGSVDFFKKLKFYVKVFFCDGQDTVRRAILYVDRSCYLQ